MENSKNSNTKNKLTVNEYYEKLDYEYNSMYEETEDQFWNDLGISYNEWVKEWEKVKFN
jgi:hypothetical protein